jgi:putative endonuclease
MAMFYTYVLLSKRDGHFYTGYTNDLRKRVRQHETGDVPSTASRRPLTLIYYEACPNRDDALCRERFLKTTKGKRFLKNRLRLFLKSAHPSKAPPD